MTIEQEIFSENDPESELFEAIRKLQNYHREKYPEIILRERNFQFFTNVHSRPVGNGDVNWQNYSKVLCELELGLYPEAVALDLTERIAEGFTPFYLRDDAEDFHYAAIKLFDQLFPEGSFDSTNLEVPLIDMNKIRSATITLFNLATDEGLLGN